MKFFLLLSVKMPTIVGILTFISRINTASESFKARKILIFEHFSFYEQLKFHTQLSSFCRAEKMNLSARHYEYLMVHNE